MDFATNASQNGVCMTQEMCYIYGNDLVLTTAYYKRIK